MNDPVMLVRVTRRGEDPSLEVYHTGWTIAQAMQEWLCEGIVIEILSVYEYNRDRAGAYDRELTQQFTEAERRYASCSSD